MSRDGGNIIDESPHDHLAEILKRRMDESEQHFPPSRPNIELKQV